MVLQFLRALSVILWLLCITLPCESATSLVEGDIDDLPALAETTYLEHAPVFIFRDQLNAQSKNILSKVSNIIFIDSTPSDLSIEITPKLTVDVQKNAILRISESGLYEIYAVRKNFESNCESNNEGYFRLGIDEKQFEPSLFLKLEGVGRIHVHIADNEFQKGTYNLSLSCKEGRLVVVPKAQRENNELIICSMLDKGLNPVYVFSKPAGQFYVPRAEKSKNVTITTVFSNNINSRSIGINNWIQLDDQFLSQRDFLPTDDKAIFSRSFKSTGGWHTYSIPAKAVGIISRIIIEFKQEKEVPEASNAPLLTFCRVNPSKYIVRVKEANAPFWLILGEQYYDLWRLYTTVQPENDALLSSSDVVAKFPDLGIKEIRQRYAIQFGDIRFFKLPFLDIPHYQVNGFANGWYIDPVKLGLGQNFDLVVFYWPQAVFYFSLCVSGIVLAISIFTLITITIMRWQQKNRK